MTPPVRLGDRRWFVAFVKAVAPIRQFSETTSVVLWAVKRRRVFVATNIVATRQKYYGWGKSTHPASAHAFFEFGLTGSWALALLHAGLNRLSVLSEPSAVTGTALGLPWDGDPCPYQCQYHLAV